MRINSDISDIFFNTDLEHCFSGGGGDLSFDRAKLKVEAQLLIDSLHRLGVSVTPSSDDLVDDFLGRV